MEIFETLVERYLTYDGKVFVAPQYTIAWNAGAKIGGSCPDFVLIDESGPSRELVVVEVTTGLNLKPLFEKIENRDLRWFAPLRARFRTSPRLIVFLRRAVSESARKWAETNGIPSAEVCFHPLEDAVFPWDYDAERLANGLPR